MNQPQIQAQAQILRTKMNAFFYPFAKTLLLKLRELKEENRIGSGLHVDDLLADDGIAYYIAVSLYAQLGRDCSGEAIYLRDIDKLIEVAEEFLEMIEDSVK